MWQEDNAGSPSTVATDVKETITTTKESQALKPYPLPFTKPDTADNFFAWERNANFRQRYFELEELLEYAVESGKLENPDLAKQVKNLKKILYYTPPVSADALCDAEAELERLYAIMAQLVSPVNIISLRTTSEQYPVERIGWRKRLGIFLGSGSIAHNFFRQFYWVGGLLTGLMLALILFVQTEPSTTNTVIAPFLFGAIGAWLYLYKTLTDYASARVLNREKIGFDWLRLFTGTLVGGLTVLLFRHTSELSGVLSATLGLIAGYSVDFFYQILDQFVQKMLPKKPETPTSPPTPRQQQIESLIRRLKEADNEEDKITIRRLLEKM